MLIFIDCGHCHSVTFVHKLECVIMSPALHFLPFTITMYVSCLAFSSIYHYDVCHEIKCSLSENFTEVVLCLKLLFVALDS